jgi:oligosaccharide repeat unit polymerase
MIFLTLSLVLLTLVAYYINNRSLVSPSILFCGGMTIASFIAWINQKTWNLELDIRTLLVITLGAVEFILVGYITNFIFNIIYSRTRTQKMVPYNGIPEYINKRFRSVLLIQLIILCVAIFTIRQTTGISNLMSAINYINYIQNGFIKGQINLPSYFGIILLFNSAAGMMAGYVFLENIIVKRKFDFILFFNLLLGLATPLLTGARGDSIVFLIALTILGYFIVKEQNNWNSANTKYVVVGIIGAIVFVFVFEWSASLVGRNMENSNLGEYISTYMGAEIANLNEFIKNRSFPIKGEIFGQQTFVTILPTLSRVFQFTLPDYKLDIPFQILNGHNTGNVATMYYSWLYDFGYMGIGILTIVVSSVGEVCYKFAKQSNGFRIIKLIYSYIGALISLSFFSNRFFENLNVNFLYMIILWIVLKYILFRRGKNA